MRVPIKFTENLLESQGAIPIIFGNAGFGLIQSIGVQGIKSLILDDGSQTYRDFSKYCRRIKMPRIASLPREAMEFLKAVCLSVSDCYGNRPVLFPVSDYALSFVLDHYIKIEKFTTIACAPLEALGLTLNKVKFYRWLHINGLPFPRTISSQNLSEIETQEHRDGISFPCLVKPEYTYRLEEMTDNKLLVAHDRKELKHFRTELLNLNMDFVIQEIVPGKIEDQFALAGYCTDGGDILCYVMTNKLRQRYFGAGTFVSSADIPELYEIGKKLLEKLEYKGIFEIEFKKDARDGTYKIIEFNPRCWSQIMLATRMKVNVAYYAYCDLAGVKGGNVKVTPIKRRKYWMDFERDLGHIKRKMVNRDYSLRGALRILLSFPCVEPFNLRDIRPGLSYLKKKIATKLKKEFKSKVFHKHIWFD